MRRHRTKRLLAGKVINTGREILTQEKARRIIKYRAAADKKEPLPYIRIETEGERIGD